jgi:hypothetical protein
MAHVKWSFKNVFYHHLSFICCDLDKGNVPVPKNPRQVTFL